MNNVKKLSLALLLAFLCAPTSAAAADAREGERDHRDISARAGGVNFVSGDVRVRRAGSEEWRALTTEDELKSGDLVRTGAGGRVEVLLNPGSYFRAGSGAEFTLAETDLDGLRIELARGAAVVEAMGYSNTDLSIEVATPRAAVRIIRSGVYRVNALEDGGAEVAVFEGRAMLGGILVKGGKRARTGAAGVEAAKFDKKKSRDELDLWSRDRGKELAKANDSLTARSINTLFARSAFDQFGPYGHLSPYRYTSGFWFYNSRARCYTFLPYGANWRSPYGYWYGTGVVYPRQWGPGVNPGQNPNPGYTPSQGGGGAGSLPPPPPPSSGGGSNGGGFGGGGGAAPTRPTPSERDRMPVNPRVDRVDPGTMPRRDNR